MSPSPVRPERAAPAAPAEMAAAGSEIDAAEYRIESEPYYLPIARECERFEAAWRARLPVLLKGPTGCGKTRFVEHMAWRLLGAASKRRRAQLITVACHEDLTASDLVGKYLLKGEETLWVDGPLTKAVATGAICYLDEIVEARKDTTVIIHPLADHRRTLPIEKKGTLVQAHEDFLLVISYNPGYQSVFKNLKPSTRQRFVAIEFDYPPPELEARIIAHECAIGEEQAAELARLGQKVRHLKSQGLEEGVSTRLLIYAGKLLAQAMDPREACRMALVEALTDEGDVQQALADLVDSIFP